MKNGRYKFDPVTVYTTHWKRTCPFLIIFNNTTLGGMVVDQGFLGQWRPCWSGVRLRYCFWMWVIHKSFSSKSDQQFGTWQCLGRIQTYLAGMSNHSLAYLNEFKDVPQWITIFFWKAEHSPQALCAQFNAGLNLIDLYSNLNRDRIFFKSVFGQVEIYFTIKSILFVPFWLL